MIESNSLIDAINPLLRQLSALLMEIFKRLMNHDDDKFRVMVSYGYAYKIDRGSWK